MFQSSPARGGGCNDSLGRDTVALPQFQSSPARGGGCNTATHSPKRPARRVSILTRPWGRVQHGSTDRYSAGRQFQSSPARGGRCNSSSQASCATASRSFNPHPPVGAGATVRRPQRRARRLCFNPHPPVGAGATLRARSKPSRTISFQSSPARGGGCNTVYDGYRFRSRLVSILTRPWGRVQRCNERVCDSWVAVSILTRPWGRVQRGLENARERFPKRKCSSCQGVPCRALGG
jgi:hypothetical protein